MIIAQFGVVKIILASKVKKKLQISIKFQKEKVFFFLIYRNLAKEVFKLVVKRCYIRKEVFLN